MISIFILVDIIYNILAYQLNPDYIIHINVYFFISILVYIFIKIKYASLAILHPIFIFNIVYLLIFASGSLISTLTSLDLENLILYFYLSINFGFLIYYIFLKIRKGSKKVNRIIVSNKAHHNYIFFSLLIGVIFTLVYFKMYGIPLLSQNINESRTISNEGGVSPIFQLIMYNANIAMYLFIVIKIGQQVNKIKIQNYVLFVIYLILLILTANRTSLYYILIPSLFYYIYLNRDINYLKLFLFVFSFILMVSYFGAMRNGEVENIFIPVFKEVGAIQFNIYNIYNFFSVGEELYYGEMHLKGFNVLLPGHQLDMSLFLKEKLNIDFTGGGLTPSIVGQIYIDFGFLGIVIEGVLLGAFFSYLFEILLLESTKIYKVYIYMFLLSYVPYLIRNGIFYSYAILFSLFYLYFYRYLYVQKRYLTHG